MTPTSTTAARPVAKPITPTVPGLPLAHELLVLRTIAGGADPAPGIVRSGGTHKRDQGQVEALTGVDQDHITAIHLAYPGLVDVRHRVTELQHAGIVEPPPPPVHPRLAKAPVEAAAPPAATQAQAPSRPAPAAGPDGRVRVLMDVAMHRIVADPDNPRSELTGITELAASMEAQGLLQPVVLRRDPAAPEHLVLVAGHRRHAAAAHLGWTHLPAIVMPTMTLDDALAAMLVENGQRADLDPVDEARAVARLIDRDGLTQAAAGALLGRSTNWVGRRLAILALAPSELASLRAGHMPLSQAERIGTNRIRNANPRDGHRVTGRSTAASSGWHFTTEHPLHAAAAGICRGRSHGTARRLRGTAACGACWETAIRHNERTLIQTDPTGDPT